MEKQTTIPNQVVNPLGRARHLQTDCDEQIEAMEAIINRLRNRFQTMRESLERLQNWLEPIEPPSTIIDDPFIILVDDEEGETK
jgi:archaellum component FlaC